MFRHYLSVGGTEDGGIGKCRDQVDRDVSENPADNFTSLFDPGFCQMNLEMVADYQVIKSIMTD